MGKKEFGPFVLLFHGESRWFDDGVFLVDSRLNLSRLLSRGHHLHPLDLPLDLRSRRKSRAGI